MQRYENAEGKSDIAFFEIGQGTITLEFAGGGRLLYTEESVGALTLAEMQSLAKAGKGLSTFIANNLRDRYARELDADASITQRRMKAQEELRQMRGTVAWEGDLDAMRRD